MTPLTFAPLFPGRRLLISQPDGTTKKLELLEFFLIQKVSMLVQYIHNICNAEWKGMTVSHIHIGIFFNRMPSLNVLRRFGFLKRMH